MYFCFCRILFNNQKIVEDSMVPSDSFQNIILAIGVGVGKKRLSVVSVIAYRLLTQKINEKYSEHNHSTCHAVTSLAQS